jgi:hypothetical protein
MAEMRPGARVTFNGRAYEITGFTSMSVKPRRVFLKDPQTGEQIVIDAHELAAGELQRPPEQSSHETS